jgi:predicted dehydrogenase
VTGPGRRHRTTGSDRPLRATGAGAPLRWGVLGATSTVARLAVLPAMAASPGADLVAIATRAAAGTDVAGGDDPAVAELMAPVDISATRVLARYQALLDDPDVEAVYVPLPNGLHAEWTVRAAEAGKHVLCEKPLSVDPTEAAAMVDACSAAGVVLAEAYMTPFHPRVRRLAGFVAEGSLGSLRFARAGFTFPLDRPDDHRWDPVMGSGALADVGIYCLAPLLEAAGRRPRAMAGATRRTAWGVDASTSGWLDFGEGFSAVVECSFEAPERQVLELVGTDGAVTVDRAFTPGPADTGFEVRRRDGTATRVETGGADAYRAMVEEFAAVVRGAAAPARTLDDTLALIEVAHELRSVANR